MRRSHYYGRYTRFEDGHLVVESFPEDEIVPHVSKRLVLELKSFSVMASRWQHYYAGVTCKIEDNKTVVIDMQCRVTEAMRKTQPHVWDDYAKGDLSSRFMGTQAAIDATVKWFSRVFPDGSGWDLTILEWVKGGSDKYGDYYDHVERVLVSKDDFP